MSKKNSSSFNGIVSDSESTQREYDHSKHSEDRIRFHKAVRMRQNSADMMHLEDALDLNKMRAYVREQKNISDFELMELR